MALSVAATTPLRAEVGEITVAQQYGVSFLPLMMMQADKLVEKHAAAAGIKDLAVNWAKLAGPSAMNDGLISGSLTFAAQGAPSLITLWSKTNGQIKGLSAITTYPLYLVTRNPKVKTLKDFSAEGQDRGALDQDLDAGDHVADGRRQGLRRTELRQARSR